MDPYEYFGTEETNVSVRLLSDYMMGQSGSKKYSKLRRGIRDTVIATWKVEDVWLRDKTERTQYLIRRYIGTANGVFRETPGDVLAKGFDPRNRPWYVKLLRICWKWLPRGQVSKGPVSKESDEKHGPV